MAGTACYAAKWGASLHESSALNVNLLTGFGLVNRWIILTPLSMFRRAANQLSQRVLRELQSQCAEFQIPQHDHV